MTRQPIRTIAPINDVPFPLNIRFLIAGWKLLFFRNERFRTGPNSNDTINRSSPGYASSYEKHPGQSEHRVAAWDNAAVRSQVLARSSAA
jgi:hypothetical protein